MREAQATRLTKSRGSHTTLRNERGIRCGYWLSAHSCHHAFRVLVVLESLPQMKYQVISAASLTELTAFVNNEIRHGWKVTGGLAVYPGPPAKEILHGRTP